METLLHRLEGWANEDPDSEAQAWKEGVLWKKLPASELRNRVEALGRYLVSEGLTSGDVGLIYAFNGPAWVQMDLALMLVGASSAGIYTNSSDRQIQYILRHSEAKLLVVENAAALQKIARERKLHDEQ